MAINTYDKGDTVRLHGYFTTSGTAADPDNVALKVKWPDATISTYLYSLAEVTKSATGRYFRDVLMNQVGQVYYYFGSTGSFATAGENYLIIRPSEFD